MSKEVSNDALAEIESRARQELINGEYNKASVMNPATILMLLGQLQSARDLNRLTLVKGDYHQGYLDGWADKKATPDYNETPVGWALVSPESSIAKVFAKPPAEVPAGMQCRPLYMKSDPNDQSFSKSMK
ncbi:MAG: hypothetical protein R3194_01200 [Limnobacter sp.]|nr:hypothetical protein [Limnobacter sp.]